MTLTTKHGWPDLLAFMWKPQYDGLRRDAAPGETFDTCRGVTEMLRASAEQRGIAPWGVALQDLSDAQLATILHWECWLPVQGDALSVAGAPGAAFMLGNMAAQAGAGRAVQLVQRLLGGLAVDGGLGQKTLAAILAAVDRGVDLVAQLAAADDAFFAQCRQANLFLHGWELRIADAVATVRGWEVGGG
jgi:lysozyme family protein